jgi:hypothetical protein
MAKKPKRRKRRAKRKAALYDIRVKLYHDQAMKLKQVLFCNEQGYIWSAEILAVCSVDF